jgi:hypothetical protein
MSSMFGAQGSSGQRGYGATGLSSKSGDIIPKGYKKGQLQNFTPEMMQLFQHLIGQLGPESFLSKIAAGDEGAFAQMEAPALKQFTGEIGNLASRFSGMGMGARHSSGFQNEATTAASDFAQRLQSNRMGLQSQALRDLQSMGNQLLSQRPYEKSLVKKDDFLSQLLSGSGDVVDMITKLLPFFV